MTLDDWRRLAAFEAAMHLHDFNSKRELSVSPARSSHTAALHDAYAGFGKFLASRSIADYTSAPFPVADDLLQEFHRNELGRAPSDSACFCGEPARSNVAFLTLAGLSRLGPSEFGLFDRFGIGEIENSLVLAAQNPSVQFDSEGAYTENSISVIDTALRGAIERPPSDLKPIPSDPLATTRSPSILEPERVIWLTSKTEIEEEIGGDLNPENVIAAVRVGLGRDLKSLLGIFNKSRDWIEDRKTPVIYRVVFAIHIIFDESFISGTAQPRLFSGGFYDLWVARDPDNRPSRPGPGQTVRLQESSCGSADHAICRCGAPAVTEIVSPLTIIRKQKKVITGSYVLSSAVLRGISAPGLDTIRKKNA